MVYRVNCTVDKSKWWLLTPLILYFQKRHTLSRHGPGQCFWDSSDCRHSCMFFPILNCCSMALTTTDSNFITLLTWAMMLMFCIGKSIHARYDWSSLLEPWIVCNILWNILFTRQVLCTVLRQLTLIITRVCIVQRYAFDFKWYKCKTNVQPHN